MTRRIGFLVDSRLFQTPAGFRAEEPLIQFLLGFRAYFDELVFVARVFPEDPEVHTPYALGEDGVRVVALPPYPRIHHLMLQPWRYWGAIDRALRQVLPELDAVWLNFGHPVSQRALGLSRAHPRLRPFAVLRGAYDRDVALRTPGPAFVKQAASRGMRALLGAFARRALKLEVPCFTYGRELVERLAELGVQATPLIDSVVRDADLETEPEIREELRDDLLVVGRLAPEKGVDVLLHALPDILCDGRPATLRVVGSGESEAELQALATRLGIAERVHFDGHVPIGPELFARYASARLLVIPSHTEGIPKTAIEAMACGRALLATRVGGLPEVVGEREERGRLVPPNDPAALARAANELLADPTALHEMESRAAEFARGITLERQVRLIMAAALPDLLSDAPR